MFSTRAAAVREMRNFRTWPKRKVICLYVPGAKMANEAGYVYCVEIEKGRFLKKGGSIG